MADDAGRLNEVLAETSFLYGGNAGFVEDLHAQVGGRPGLGRAVLARLLRLAARQAPTTSVAARTRRRRGRRRRSPSRGPTGCRPSTACGRRWTPSCEARIGAAQPTASPDEVRARTLDSLRAIMMIRAYRMRGHLKANLDPLGLAVTAGRRQRTRSGHATASPRADFDRPIFLDYVLGLETATRARDPGDPEAHLLRHRRRAVHAHHRSGRKGLAAAAHRGPRQGDHLHPRRQDRHPEEADRGRGLRALPAQALPRHQAVRPRRRAKPWFRRWSRSSSAAARWACATSSSACRTAAG